MTAPTDDGLLGADVDLVTCAREPIHIPGAIQPHGVLLALREPELTVVQASANLADLLGVTPDDALGRPVTDVLRGELAQALVEAAGGSSDPSEHYPLPSVVEVAGRPVAVDALLHRTDGLLVVEIEPGTGPLTSPAPTAGRARRWPGSTGRPTRGSSTGSPRRRCAGSPASTA